MAYAAFFVIAAIAAASALGLILRKNAIHGALFLVVNLGSIAALYLTLGAEFLAAHEPVQRAQAGRVRPTLFRILDRHRAAGPRGADGKGHVAPHVPEEVRGGERKTREDFEEVEAPEIEGHGASRLRTPASTLVVCEPGVIIERPRAGGESR